MKSFLVRRWWLLLVIPMVVGLARLRLDVQVLNLLPSQLPAVAGLQLYQRHFAQGDELILTVAAEDAEATESAARQLALGLRERSSLVSRVFWQPPWRENREALAELLALAWLNQPPDIFASLARRLGPGQLSATLAETRQTLATSLSPSEIARSSYDPLGFSRLPESLTGSDGHWGQGDEAFASGDGRFRVLFARPARSLGSYRDCADWLDRMRAAVEEIRHAHATADQVEIAFTGAPAYIAETALGMEGDMQRSAVGTLGIIAMLFWWAHRRWRPLFSLVALLSLVLAGATALGGLIFGTLNAVSLGFAAILLGLVADYALVLYQEARDRTNVPVAELRRNVGPGIFWSALTTASAFALLNFAGLPGLAQLGTLVALGILLGAGLMLIAFLPLALSKNRTLAPGLAAVPQPESPPRTTPSMAALWLTGLGAAVMAAMFWWHPPTVDHSAEALSPRHIPAHDAMQAVKKLISGEGEPLWLLVLGRDESEVAQRLQTVEMLAHSTGSTGGLAAVRFPSALWPCPERQAANHASAMELVARQSDLRAAGIAAGFSEDAFALADGVWKTWRRAQSETRPLWPATEPNVWLLHQAAARTEAGWVVLGSLGPTTNVMATFQSAAALVKDHLPAGAVRVASWAVLGEALLQHAQRQLAWLLAAIVLLTAVCLWLAFRSVREVLLSYAALALSLGLLLVVMSLLGWSWNLMNLMAVPLLLGAGVDYGIHVQLALRRHRGDAATVRRTTGRALTLCAATSFAAFSSLAWSSSAGLAGLGLVCAAGVACVLLVSLFFLPAWWNLVAWSDAGPVPPLAQPSALYRSSVWRGGLLTVRLLPRSLARIIARCLGQLCWRFDRRRREVVVQNLLPVLGGSRPSAETAARQLYGQFASKLLDLWEVEAGGQMEDRLQHWSGWELFTTAQARGSGVLLVTTHLGNWELGGVLLAARGVKLLVLTQAEPGNGFTDLRRQSRARWGIETLVVGEDPFAFVEIVKRLQSGDTVALLVDRPAAASGATVQLFGRPFKASVAAAELARASGCALLAAYVVQEGDRYAAHMLGEIKYDRTAIGDRAARVQLTQEIVRAFEPAIRQHANQWYHFVPIWPELQRSAP